MTILPGAICSSVTPVSLVFSSRPVRFHGAAPGFLSCALNPSSFWGSSCSRSRLTVPTAKSDSSLTTRPTSRITTVASMKSDVPKKPTTSWPTTAREATTSLSMMSSVAAEGAIVAEETSTSYASKVTGGDVKAWKARRAARKTTRRRALAICLALAGLTQHRPSSSAGVESDHQPSESQARDLIRLSQSSEVPPLTISTASGERYGDLVTVSTGSSDSLNNEKAMVYYRREDFQLGVPYGWIESNAEIATGSVLRYEDKADPTTNVVVLRSPTSKSRTGKNPEDWIKEQAYLLSDSNEPIQFQSGDEGTDTGRKFPSGKVSIAKVLNVDKPKYKQGLTYYNYEILTKQGGEQRDELHELVSAVVNNGNLYMCRVQTGEDRWQEDSQSMAQRIVDSFQITGFKINM